MNDKHNLKESAKAKQNETKKPRRSSLPASSSSSSFSSSVAAAAAATARRRPFHQLGNWWHDSAFFSFFLLSSFCKTHPDNYLLREINETYTKWCFFFNHAERYLRMFSLNNSVKTWKIFFKLHISPWGSENQTTHKTNTENKNGPSVFFKNNIIKHIIYKSTRNGIGIWMEFFTELQ